MMGAVLLASLGGIALYTYNLFKPKQATRINWAPNVNRGGHYDVSTKDLAYMWRHNAARAGEFVPDESVAMAGMRNM